MADGDTRRVARRFDFDAEPGWLSYPYCDQHGPDLRSGATVLADELTVDLRPDFCWRCDAAPGAEELLGLCGPCHQDLTQVTRR
jgi:hypothetical protein